MLRCCNLPDIWIIGLEKIQRNTFTRIFSFVVHFCFNCNPSFLFFFLIKRFSSGQQQRNAGCGLKEKSLINSKRTDLGQFSSSFVV